ncbi:hypothetical protein ACIPY5_20040 [Microbacterium sp. NPDC089698]|uniref:hypothetical protein n=1 Tax=Microbacterium sp. NPDC089698 TaxID=3364200 RepID=UPI0037F3B111
MNQHPDITRFVQLRQELTKMRTQQEGIQLSPAERDFVALAQAEALCDIAATLNGGITVSTE